MPTLYITRLPISELAVSRVRERLGRRVPRRYRPGVTTGTPILRASAGSLDYYLLRPASRDEARATGLLIEEFVLTGDLCAERLRSASWSPEHGGWRSSAAFARELRTDPALRARVAAVSRRSAEAAHEQLGGGPLPGEDILRGHFRDDLPLSSAAPLRLSAAPAVHRVLFAGELSGEQLASVRALLRLGDPPAGEQPGVAGSGRLRVNDTNFHWDLRRVGGAAAWCVDVRSEPADAASLRWVLRQLTDVARSHGLLPAAIDRLG
jgi:hypothetical protein